MISDNGLQFSVDAFSQHSQMIMDLRTYITSSPQFPQSNGEVEHAVKTVKALLKKYDDRKRKIII